jgi:hypothetical protein
MTSQAEVLSLIADFFHDLRMDGPIVSVKTVVFDDTKTESLLVEYDDGTEFAISVNKR